MTANKRLVSVRVDGELWKRIKVAAVSAGLSAASVVEGALELWLRMDDGEKRPTIPPFDRRVSPDQFDDPVKAGARVNGPASAAKAEPAIDARCANCGERWAFHQLGSNKNRAKNGCANFRET